MLTRTCAHHGVRARVDRRAVSTSMIYRPTVDEQVCSVSGVPHDLYAVEIRQINDDALAPSDTHYKVPSGESALTRGERDCSNLAAAAGQVRVSA